MIGQTLNNRYAVTAQLGKGAMGIVYAATDKVTRQKVALKVIAHDLTPDHELLERFQREAEALRRLRHHNIVALVDMFEHKGQQVIVLEYVPGGSLAQRLRQGPLPPYPAAQLALDLCDALTSAHRLDIIHRDIKPENILLAEDGTPKLTDFGVARLMGTGTRLTGTGTQVGTPYYMSPEAWEGKPLDAQADVWSLGVVLFEMLAGRVPFAGDTVVAVMHQVLEAPLPDLAELRPEVAPELGRVVKTALCRDKAGRYRGIRPMAIDLEEALLAIRSRPARGLAAEPPKTSPAPAEVRTRPAPVGAPPAQRTAPARRPRWGWLAGGAALAAVVGGALLVCGSLGLGMLSMSGAGRAAPTVSASAVPATPAPVQTETSSPSVTVPPPTGTLAPSVTPTQVVIPPTLTLTPSPRPSATPSATPVIKTAARDDMPLVYVPEGEFLMGSADSDRLAIANEKPQRVVYLDAFWMDRTEVTNAMYARCVGAGVCVKPWNTMAQTGGSYYDNPLYANYPVAHVSWQDANTYCRWAGRRLPTEAEWEKAARGMDGRLYPWGNRTPSGLLLNFDSFSGDFVEVGQFPGGSSPYGALDMAGNAWEWVADWYAADYYATGPARNPPGPSAGENRVLRGGGWDSGANVVRAALRFWGSPYGQNDANGFRCAVSP